MSDRYKVQLDRRGDRDRHGGRRERSRDRDRGGYERRPRDRSRDKSGGGERRRSRSRERERDRDRPPKDEKDEKEEAAPPRKKKNSNWDKDIQGNQVPTGVGIGGADPSFLNAIVQQAASQAPTKARRIYIGNLPSVVEVDAAALGEFFDHAMEQGGLKNMEVEGSTAKDVWISAEKKFAFIEVRSFDEAQKSMSLDGISFHGTPLKIARPHDYVPPPSTEVLQSALKVAENLNPLAAVQVANAAATLKLQNPNLPMLDHIGRIIPMGVNQQITGAALAALGLQTGVLNAGLLGVPVAQNMQALLQMSRKCRRVHVGSLPQIPGNNADTLKRFVCAMMHSMHLSVKPGDPVMEASVSADQKYGFLELRTIQEANNALSLSGVEYLGKGISVKRTNDYVPPSLELLQQLEGSGILGIPGDAGVVVLGMEPDLVAATNVVVLKNMMTEAELGDDQECKEISDDTKDKCEADYGRVEKILVARPGSETCPPECIGQVYVHFSDVETAIKAAQGLHNLKFDGRIVEAGFVSVEEFEKLRAMYPDQE